LTATGQSALFEKPFVTTNRRLASTLWSCRAGSYSMHPMKVSRRSSPAFSGARSAIGAAPLSAGAKAALILIRAYKLLLSPLFTGSCRFVPSCATYSSEAIARFGVVRGGWLGAKRLCRCHPFGGHGLDPVPND
jgi:uncharacterized protein